jgi:hypothetical protein
MAKKAQPARTSPRIIWKLIAAEMAAQEIQRAEIAKRIGVHVNTVNSDAKEPEKMPLDRVFNYLAALDIDPEIMLRPIAISIAERMIR